MAQIEKLMDEIKGLTVLELNQLVQESGNPQSGLEDIFWSVLNAREFVFNH